ncbi:hypothetical protein D3C84_906650 [compost metagenome]
MVTIGQVLEIADETLRRLQHQQRTTRRQYINPMDQLTALDPYHGPCTGTGRDNGRNIAQRRVENAKTPTITQTLSQLHFVTQQAQIAATTSQDKHAWMSARVDVGQQLFAHCTEAQMLVAILTYVVKDHEFTKKRIT